MAGERGLEPPTPGDYMRIRNIEKCQTSQVRCSTAQAGISLQNPRLLGNADSAFLAAFGPFCTPSGIDKHSAGWA
jgi:hypothetical protein